MVKAVREVAMGTLKKIAATLYRGMGASFVPEVLEQGLLPGHSMSSDLAIGEEYAGKGATNLLIGDIHAGRLTPKEVRDRRLLAQIGLNKHHSHIIAPMQRKPEGALLSINIPDEALSAYTEQPKATQYLKEYVSTKTIPPNWIKVLPQGYRAPGGFFPAAARRLSNEHLRLIAAAVKQGKGDGARNIIENIPQSHALDLKERLQNVRSERVRTARLLRALLK